MAKVLIVEDESLLAISTSLLLEDLGHEVIGMATGAEEALAISERNVPEILLMDISLKGDVNGIELGRILSEKYGCEIIFMTGNSASTLSKNHPSILYKPFVIEDLVRALDFSLGNIDA